MYKVTEFRMKATLSPGNDRLDDATALISKYGLAAFYTPAEVAALWEEYSDSMCAGWLIPDKDSVERVFNVTLEEVSE